jgi:8-oxo-dGTP pyrophosphatase MutT (NUDIX family)
MLLKLLENYTSKFVEELFFREQMLDFLINNDHPFSRQNLGHFTASAFLLNKDKTKFLLMHHRKLNQWFQVGGHADDEKDLLQVAIKEAREESGIDDIHPISKEIFDIDIHLIPKSSNQDEHYHYDVRFLLKANSDNFIVNEESLDLAWVDFYDYEKYPINNSVKRMIAKYILKYT